MKSRRYIFAFLSAVMALSACKKDAVPVSDHPFDITTPKIEATRVVMDVIPDNNDFYYLFGAFQAEAFESLGQTKFVELMDNLAKETYKALFETTSLDGFLDWTYRGAYEEVVHDLVPNTRYIVFAYPYDDLNPMAEKFTKVEFTTPELVKSENKFEITVDGTVISVSPSNGDSYFFDYCTAEELDDYYMSIDYFFRESIDVYWEYGFLDSFISKGASSEDIKDYYEYGSYKIADGDVFYMAISGYDKGITTDVSYYKITVHFGSTKSSIEQIEDFDHSTKSSASPLFFNRISQGSDEVAGQNLPRLLRK